MKIAICDDDIKITGQIEKWIEECLSNKNMFEIDVFFSGEVLIRKLEENRYEYQIYFIDIEMMDLNGLEVANIIRFHDNNAIIIFITSHVEFMQEAFDVLAFHFLTKPLHSAKVKGTILRAIENLMTKKTVFQYNIRKRKYSLYLDQIEYFESYNRKIIIHCQGKNIEYYGNIDEVLSNVGMNLFAQVHKSYIVNMDCVKVMEGESITLCSGIKIAITKKYCHNFNVAYRNFVLVRINPEHPSL